MVENNECVTHKWELEVTCNSCKKNITLKNSSDIVRLTFFEYPYGIIAGFVLNQFIFTAYYCECPHCGHLQHIKRRFIPRKIRKDIQTLTTYYWQPPKGSCSCEQGPFALVYYICSYINLFYNTYFFIRITPPANVTKITNPNPR